jgi:hypothetical protein
MTTKLKKLQKKVFNILPGKHQEQEEVLSAFISYAQCYDEQKIGMRFAFLISSLMMLVLISISACSINYSDMSIDTRKRILR